MKSVTAVLATHPRATTIEGIEYQVFPSGDYTVTAVCLTRAGKKTVEKVKCMTRKTYPDGTVVQTIELE